MILSHNLPKYFSSHFVHPSYYKTTWNDQVKLPSAIHSSAHPTLWFCVVKWVYSHLDISCHFVSTVKMQHMPFGQSDWMVRPNYCVKQHSGFLNEQPGVWDIIIPLVMQNSYKLLSPGEFAKHATQRQKIQLRWPENKERYLYDGTSKTNRAFSVEWQI